MSIFSFLTKIVMMTGISNHVIKDPNVIKESKFVIIKSEMSESMKKHAMGTAMVAFEEPGIPIQSKRTDIAVKLSSEFDAQYGKHWFCLVGPPGFVSHFDHIAGTLLWFSYKEIQVILFKIARQTQNDIIRGSRRTDKMNVKVLRSEMSEAMKAQAFTATIMAFHEYNTFEKIAENVSSVFDQMHGQHWQCVVGYQAFNTKVEYTHGTYISFELSDAQVVLFQVMLQEKPYEVISSGRFYVYHPIIEYNSVAKSVRTRLVRVAIENIYRYDNFLDIAKGITGTLSAENGIYWACVVGHTLFLAEDIPECHHHSLSVNFGELRVLLCTFDIRIKESDGT